jgi:hypothetical protein
MTRIEGFISCFPGKSISLLTIDGFASANPGGAD